MLTVRSAAKVPPASWPDGGCELDPISSKSLTKLPAPNWAAGRFIVMFGLTLFTWLLLLVEPMPDCELQTPSVQVGGVAAGSAWLIPRSLSWIWAAEAFPLAFAPAGLKTVKLTGLTLVRSFSSALNEVEARVFMATKRTLLQGISPIVSLTLRASSPKRLIPVAVSPVMLGAVFTAASQRIP